MMQSEARNCPNSPRLTGIPPHTALLSEIDSLKKSVERSQVEMREALKEELDKRSVGGEVFAANAILQGINDVHQRMIETLNASQSSSAVTETVHLHQQTYGAFHVEEGMEIIQEEAGGEEGGQAERHTMYFWGGKFHNIPLRFVFPTT